MMTEKLCFKLVERGLRGLVEIRLGNEMLQANQTPKAFVNPPEEIELFTNRELMRKLSMSDTTLWRHRRAGMPHFKKGKKIYYEFGKVVKWIGGMRYEGL